MATYSREQFVRQVLIELTVLDANEAPEAEDAAQAEMRTQQKFEELYEDGLIPFDVDTDEIPGRYFLPLVSIVAFECMTQYGLQAKAEELVAKAEAGNKRLWKLRQRAYVHTPTQADYF